MSLQAMKISSIFKNHRAELAALALFLALFGHQKDWLLDLLMAEKDKVDKALEAEGGGHI